MWTVMLAACLLSNDHRSNHCCYAIAVMKCITNRAATIDYFSNQSFWQLLLDHKRSLRHFYFTEFELDEAKTATTTSVIDKTYL